MIINAIAAAMCTASTIYSGTIGIKLVLHDHFAAGGTCLLLAGVNLVFAIANMSYL